MIIRKGKKNVCKMCWCTTRRCELMIKTLVGKVCRAESETRRWSSRETWYDIPVALMCVYPASWRTGSSWPAGGSWWGPAGAWWPGSWSAAAWGSWSAGHFNHNWLHPLWSASYSVFDLYSILCSARIATLGSILDSQLSWESGKVQLARWSHEVYGTHPPTRCLTWLIEYSLWL